MYSNGAMGGIHGPLKDTKKTVAQLPTIEIGFERLGSLE